MARGLAIDRSSSRSHLEHQHQFLWLQTTAAGRPVRQPCVGVGNDPHLLYRHHKAPSAGSWEGNLTDPKPIFINRTWRKNPSRAGCRFVPPSRALCPPAPFPRSFLHPSHKGQAAPQRRAHKEPKRPCNLIIVTFILPFPFSPSPIRRRLEPAGSSQPVNK